MTTCTCEHCQLMVKKDKHNPEYDWIKSEYPKMTLKELHKIAKIYKNSSLEDMLNKWGGGRLSALVKAIVDREDGLEPEKRSDSAPSKPIKTSKIKLPKAFEPDIPSPRNEVNRIVRKLAYADSSFDEQWLILYGRYDPYDNKIIWPSDFSDDVNVRDAFKRCGIPHPLDQIDSKGDMEVLLEIAQKMEEQFMREAG